MFAIRNYKGMLFSQVQKSIFYTYLVKNSKYKCTIKQIMFGKKTELTSDPKDSKKDAEFDVSIKFLNLTKKIVQNLDNRKKKINSYIQRKRILAKKHSDHVIRLRIVKYQLNKAYNKQLLHGAYNWDNILEKLDKKRDPKGLVGELVQSSIFPLNGTISVFLYGKLYSLPNYMGTSAKNRSKPQKGIDYQFSKEILRQALPWLIKYFNERDKEEYFIIGYPLEISELIRWFLRDADNKTEFLQFLFKCQINERFHFDEDLLKKICQDLNLEQNGNRRELKMQIYNHFKSNNMI